MIKFSDVCNNGWECYWFGFWYFFFVYICLKGKNGKKKKRKKGRKDKWFLVGDVDGVLGSIFFFILV